MNLICNGAIDEAKSLIDYAEVDENNDFPTVMTLTQRDEKIDSEMENDGALKNDYLKFSASIEKLRLALENETK